MTGTYVCPGWGCTHAPMTCDAGHPLRYDAANYATPRWVHVHAADLITCPALAGAGDGADYTESLAAEFARIARAAG